ncbi:MAG: hypothetical protein JO189_04360 [Deltaproteobacteria bacterium]|nr:hypothetical protein [Deltaproteobacteria bacterium]
MNQHRSNGAVLDRTRLSTVPRDSNPSKGLQTAHDEKEAYDRERFPDGFYQGLIVSLDRVRGRGIIRSHSGREIRFEFPFVSVVGAPLGGRAPGIELLRQGDRVGFDVGWTSKGLRVTTIKPTRKENGETEQD